LLRLRRGHKPIDGSVFSALGLNLVIPLSEVVYAGAEPGGAATSRYTVSSSPREAEALAKVKQICWAAGMSAENIAEERAANIPPEDGGTYEIDRTPDFERKPCD
jgi:hypothetical protein